MPSKHVALFMPKLSMYFKTLLSETDEKKKKHWEKQVWFYNKS